MAIIDSLIKIVFFCIACVAVIIALIGLARMLSGLSNNKGVKQNGNKTNN